MAAPPDRPARDADHVGDPARAADGTDVTGLLAAWGAGDHAALDAVMPAVYAELRRQAARALRREAAGHTLQPTALVHEAYLRLAAQQPARWQGRAHFVHVAARCMRQVLVDAAHTRHAAKRGGGVRSVTLGHADAAAAGEADDRGVDVLALDEALERLAALDPVQARLVELRYFVGLSIDETAPHSAFRPRRSRASGRWSDDGCGASWPGDPTRCRGSADRSGRAAKCSRGRVRPVSPPAESRGSEGVPQ